MKKLIALTALVGLMAVGCASRENRGGAYGNQQSNLDYGTGASGTMSTTPSDQNNDSATTPNNSGSTSGTFNNNPNGTSNSGGATSPGGATSGSSSQDKTGTSSSQDKTGSDLN